MKCWKCGNELTTADAPNSAQCRKCEKNSISSPSESVGLVPDGIYDNRFNFRRESYQDGKLVAFVDAVIIRDIPIRDIPSALIVSWNKPWESYPDIPNTQGQSRLARKET
ncbi:MAG: hypothetical protein WC551_13765 [Patescibacteria group bacterium]|jgi:hypothetical protein